MSGVSPQLRVSGVGMATRAFTRCSRVVQLSGVSSQLRVSGVAMGRPPKAKEAPPSPPKRQRTSPESASGSANVAADAAVAKATPVPAVRVSAQAAAPSSGPDPPQPTMPDEKDLPGLGSKALMKKVVPWINAKLPRYLTERGQISNTDRLGLHAPLAITGEGMVSYKEVWNVDNCRRSLSQTNLYEAGGNLGWLDTQVNHTEDDDTVLPVEDPSLAWMIDYSETGFHVMELPLVSGQVVKRIRFPTAIDAYMCSMPTGSDESYPTQLFPVSGHALIWSWYFTVWQAMERDDVEKVKLLYEAAVSTTICVMVSDTSSCMAAVAEASLKSSERVRQEAQVLVDNFLTFARKVTQMSSGGKLVLRDLSNKGIRFDGCLINATMIQVIQKLNTTSQQVLKLMRQIDREFGVKVLTGSYSKIRALFQGCKNETDHVHWCLQSMIVSLNRKELSPEDYTIDVYKTDAAKDGTPSLTKLSLTTKVVVQHVANIITNLAQVNADMSAQLLNEVMTPLANPVEFDKVFASSQVVKSVPAEPTFEEEFAEEADEDESKGSAFMSRLQETVPRGGFLLAEVLQKTYDGTYTDDIVALSQKASPEEALVDMTDLGSLGADLKEALRLLHSTETIVPVSGTKAPQASLRDLVRKHSEGGDDDKKAAQAEREDAWKRAVTHRKKWITFAVCTAKTQAALSELYQKSGSQVRDFKGVAGETHRAFVVCGDLIIEKGQEPWLGCCEAPAHFSEMLKFVCAQRSNIDVVMAFDGINRKNRRVCEDAVSKLPVNAEIFITYQKPPSHWCQRKHVFASRNTEVGWYGLPVAKNKIACKDRQSDDDFSAAGEDSSHYTTYTGVPVVPRTALPLITEADKKIVVKNSQVVEMPRKWKRRGLQGVPLFWNESKSVDLWVRILQDAGIKAVVDVSPGSGTLAEACMKLGCPYFGMVFERTHYSWLSNVVDRASLKYITTNGNPLYQEDLSTHLQSLFADQIEGQQNAEFSDDDAESGGEAA